MRFWAWWWPERPVCRLVVPAPGEPKEANKEDDQVRIHSAFHSVRLHSLARRRRGCGSLKPSDDQESGSQDQMKQVVHWSQNQCARNDRKGVVLCSRHQARQTEQSV